MNYLRCWLFWLMVVAFFGMGSIDILSGKIRMGIAGIMLAVVQLLIFWRT